MIIAQDRPDFLLYGASGLLGTRLAVLLNNDGHSFALANARLEDHQAVEAELDALKPKR